MSRYNSVAQSSTLSKDKTSYIEDFADPAFLQNVQSRHVAIGELPLPIQMSFMNDADLRGKVAHLTLTPMLTPSLRELSLLSGMGLMIRRIRESGCGTFVWHYQ